MILELKGRKIWISRPVYFSKIITMTGKEWDPWTCDGNIWVSAPEYHQSSDPSGPLGLQMAWSSLLKATHLLCSALAGGWCRGLGQHTLPLDSSPTSPLVVRQITGVKSTHNLAGGSAGSAIKGKGLYTLVVAGPRQCVPAGVSEYVQDPLQCKRDRRHSFSQLLGVLAADSSQLSPPTVSLSWRGLLRPRLHLLPNIGFIQQLTMVWGG